MKELLKRGIIIVALLCVLICYHVITDRDAIISSVPVVEERRVPFNKTEMKLFNMTCDWSKWQEQDGQHNGLLSRFVQENFTGIQCPDVKVHFSEVNLPRIALASFPGSGNTWLRHLIEKMSGIATGNLYCGTKETRSTFIGDCYKNTSRTIVIKTHKEARNNTPKQYDKAVLIVRNPFDALLAEFNRRHSGKTSVASKKLFLSSAWKKYLQHESSAWGKHIYSWLVKYQGPTHVVFYEHLQNNLFEELVRLCGFLSMSSSLSDILCTIKDQEGSYHRDKPKWFVTSSFFTDNMRAAVQNEIDTLYKLIPNHDLLSEFRENFDLLYRKRPVNSN